MYYCSAYLGKMSLQFVFGIHVVSDAVSKCIVDSIPLVDHCLCTSVQETFNAVSVISGCCSFTLRLLDVVVAEFGPGVRH